jgi:hypothetical protein
MNKLVASLFLITISFHCYSQIGGKYAYDFLNLTSSAKVSALGGKYISYPDEDLSVAYYNPSLLNEQMSRHLSLSYVNYFAGVDYGYVSYAKNINDKNNMALGIQYINYGTFDAADDIGNITGTFSAAEYAFNLVYSRKLDSSFTIGGDLRPILSIYEQYQSFGFSTDWGITYHNTKKFYTLALVIRNLGTMIVPYYKHLYENLPFEIQLGYTQELQYAPFRFSITAQNLETPNLSTANFNSYNSALGLDTTQNQGTTIDKIFDNVLRHIIIGAEFIPVKNFYVRGGYNYQRRQELKIPSDPSMAGFSWGFGINISRFQINYGRATYSVAGASNTFSIAIDLSSFSGRNSSDGY